MENIFNILKSNKQSAKPKVETPHEIFCKKVSRRAKGEYRVVGEFKSNTEEIALKHLKCGQSFNIKPSYFISGTRCPFCNSSKGEIKVMKFLDKKGIKYKKEFVVPGLVSENKVHLRFDFAIFDKEKNVKCLIEYDGQQHFMEQSGNRRSKLKVTQKHDGMKNQYCKEVGIKLIRIPYWQYKNIEEILEIQLQE
jgi:hypothetical protein